MSQADVLGLATALASMGVEAEAGGTAISTIMAQIGKDVARAGDVIAGMSDLTQKEADRWSARCKHGLTHTAERRRLRRSLEERPRSGLSDLFSGMMAATTEGSNDVPHARRAGDRNPCARQT